MAGSSMFADDASSLRRCKEFDEDEISVGEMLEVGGNRLLSKPLPPMLGNGKAVDLLKLFVHVKNRGGYDVVSREGLWEQVGEDQGLCSSGFGSAIKLVYYKYLKPLERGLMNASGTVDFKGVTMDFMDLETDLKDFASTVLDSTKKNDAESEEGSTGGVNVKMDSTVENVEAVDVDSVSSGVSGNQNPCVKADLSTKGNGAESVDNVARSAIKTRKISGSNDGEEQEAIVGDSFVVKNEGSGQKRKRHSLSKMLQWMASVAMDPTNPVIKPLPDSCKWKYYGNDHDWKQVLWAREALFKKQDRLSSEQLDFQKKQKMHPSMFEDLSPSAEKVRTSRRLIYGSTSLTRTCNFSNEGASSFQKRIPVGEFFQAEVPKWTHMTTESDPKWLGTRIWPREETGLQDQYPAQKVTREPCGCQFPGSIGCIKLHISRTKMKLKFELGSAFYQWKFDSMGEEASVSWTAKEEQKFEAVVKGNPLSLGKFFWDELIKSFPTKCRDELISYYYNVFLLRRRGHQNRYSPTDIDSDDDETEFIANSNSLILSPGKKTKN